MPGDLEEELNKIKLDTSLSVLEQVKRGWIAVEEISQHLGAWEGMSDDDLIGQAPRLLELKSHLALVVSPELGYGEWVEVGAEMHELPDGVNQRFHDLWKRTKEVLLFQRVLTANARKAGNARVTKNPDAMKKADAMDKVKAEFHRWQSRAVIYENDSDFARKMHAAHAGVLKNEVSIKNACNRWRNEKKSSS